MALKSALIKTGFAGFRLTGLHTLVRARTQGLGAILMFHHVRPWVRRACAPNRELEITPEFLDGVLALVRRRGFIVVTLDDALDRLAAGRTERPFVVLTFDDGYIDTHEWALPILKRERAACTVYVTPGFVDATASLWWVEIETILGQARHIRVDLPSGVFEARCETSNEKERAGAALLPLLRATRQDALDEAMRQLRLTHDIDGAAIARSLCLDRAGLDVLAGEPLVTIGAHTMTHPMLAKTDADRASLEIQASKVTLQAWLGRDVRHFAYPVGDRASAGPRDFGLAAHAGYASAVTTRPGVIQAGDARDPMALPRVSINGRYQSLAAVDVLLSGAPFAIMDALRRR